MGEALRFQLRAQEKGVFLVLKQGEGKWSKRSCGTAGGFRGGRVTTWRGFLYSKCGLGSSRRRFCKPVYNSSSTTCECLIKETTHLSATLQSRGAQREPPHWQHTKPFKSNFCIFGLKLKELKPCQGRERTYPTAKPLSWPTNPSRAFLSSQYKEFHSWVSSQITGTMSGLFVRIHQTSSLPPIRKQVLIQNKLEALFSAHYFLSPTVCKCVCVCVKQCVSCTLQRGFYSLSMFMWSGFCDLRNATKKQNILVQSYKKTYLWQDLYTHFLFYTLYFDA